MKIDLKGDYIKIMMDKISRSGLVVPEGFSEEKDNYNVLLLSSKTCFCGPSSNS